MADAEYKRLTVGASLFKTIGKTCSIDGCGREKAARGWCKMHWTRWKKHGDPMGGSWDTPKMPDTCEIEGCGRPSRSRWEMGITVCAMHYLRRMQTGSFDAPRALQSPDGVCIEPGCCNVVRSLYAKHCERHYYQIRRNGEILTKLVKDKKVVVPIPRYSECQYCAKPTGRKKYCSARCATRASRGVPLEVKCKHCNLLFQPLNGAVCCSDGCFDEHHRTLSRNHYRKMMDLSPEFRAKVRHNEYKRKALKRNAFVEHVDRDFVMARDKWICHLCGEKIPKNAKWPSGLFGTLEHVHSLIQGGQHSYNNIKAAHLSCNCKKGGKTVGQLGLAF